MTGTPSAACDPECEKARSEERSNERYAADDAQAAEAVYLYHKCLTEISGNLAYAMVFQSFEKMIRNLIREHYKNREELRLSIPKFQLLTAAIARRDAYEADMCMLSILGRASDYLGPYLEEKQK